MPNKQLGGNHQLYSDTPSEKEMAKCFKCEDGFQQVGENKLGILVGGNLSLANINASKRNKEYNISINPGDKYNIIIENISSGKKLIKKCKNIDELRKTLNPFSIINYSITK